MSRCPCIVSNPDGRHAVRRAQHSLVQNASKRRIALRLHDAMYAGDADVSAFATAAEDWSAWRTASDKLIGADADAENVGAGRSCAANRTHRPALRSRRPALRNSSSIQLIGDVQTVAQSGFRLPSQHLTEARVVAVASAHALRAAQVMMLGQLLACDGADQRYQLVDLTISSVPRFSGSR